MIKRRFVLKNIVIAIVLLLCAGNTINYNYAKSNTVNQYQDSCEDRKIETPEEKALAVLQGVKALDETTIGHETPIINEDGSEYGSALEYDVNGESYGFAVYDNSLGKITQFVYKKGENGLFDTLKMKAKKDEINLTNPLPVLVINKNNPYSVRIVGGNGNTIDVFGGHSKYSSKMLNAINKASQKTMSKILEKSILSVNAKVDYPFINYSQLKKFVKNRYGKKMYSGYKTEYLTTFNQGNVQKNTGNKYACEVVAATFDLAMQGRIYKNTWNAYNEIYKNAKVKDGRTVGDNVKTSLNIYYKSYYGSNGFKAYYDDTNVRFADIKKCVDNDYKSILGLYVRDSGHAVPVLGYYSYFFDSQNAVDYVIISTDWYDDCEMYFDSVYLNEGEMADEADLTYMKPYIY